MINIGSLDDTAVVDVRSLNAVERYRFFSSRNGCFTSQEKKNLVERWDSSERGQRHFWQRYGCLDVEHVKSHGFAFHLYPKGELTGSRFFRGSETKPLPSAYGPRESEKLTGSAKSKIRRAIQNSDLGFKCFLTVTFDPSMSELDELGRVCQKWGKDKFKRFVNSMKKAYDRRSVITGRETDKLAYVWVCESQQNGNIHFHMLVNHRIPIAWLSKLWGQASNSIDVRSIQNLNHASCYLRKYISKGDQKPICGNRYGISQNLRESMKPIRIEIAGVGTIEEVNQILAEMKAEVEANGGRVLDFGFYVPQPCRPRKFKKKGKICETKGTDSRLAGKILTAADRIYPF